MRSVLSVVLICLTGCGGSNASTNNPETDQQSRLSGGVLTGTFVDSAVDGVTYHTLTHTGITNNKGRFKYTFGENITFYIGNIFLGEATGNSYITPIDLVSSSKNDPNNPIVVNILKILQTLDEDNNPDNGITITDDVRARADMLPVLSVGMDDFAENNEVLQFISDTTGHPNMISKIEAVDHFLGPNGGAFYLNNKNINTYKIFDSTNFEWEEGVSEIITRTFEISNNTISFIIHLFGEDVGIVSFESLTTPSGDMLNIDHVICEHKKKYCNISIPYNPEGNTSIEPGTWTYRLNQSREIFTPFHVKLSERTGVEEILKTSLPIKPYYTGGKYLADQIILSLDVMKNIYAMYDIDIEMQELTWLDNPQYAIVSGDFTDQNTSDLISEGAAETINIFFVENFISESRFLLGITPFTPGSLGIVGPYNGLLININSHIKNSELNIKLLGETAAHEIGHFLGLSHTSENNGVKFDILNDTPECANAMQRAEACINEGGDNLMFWTTPNIDSSSIENQTRLTDDQLFVIRHALIAKDGT